MTQLRIGPQVVQWCLQTAGKDRIVGIEQGNDGRLGGEDGKVARRCNSDAWGAQKDALLRGPVCGEASKKMPTLIRGSIIYGDQLPTKILRRVHQREQALR